LLWHLAIRLYEETSIFKVSYLFHHIAYVKYYQQLAFHRDI